MAEDRYLAPGSKVRLINHGDGSHEDGIIVHCWWAKELGAHDCYVAFFGQSLPQWPAGRPTYVLRYAAISLSDI